MTTLIYHNKFLFLKWNRSIKLPSSFDALKAKQFIQLAPSLYAGGEELLCQAKALRILAGLSIFRCRLLRAEIVDRCLPFVGWVYEDPRSVKQLLPKYRKFHAPASDFDNLKMKEFHATEMYYLEIIRAKNPVDEAAALDNLVAVLYRPAKKGYDSKKDLDGDIRCEFNHNALAYYARKIKDWPLPVKQAIFLWYDACRQNLINNNPMVFKSTSNYGFESQFETGLYGVMRTMAGEKLGKLKDVEDLYVHTAMLELSLTKEEEIFFEQQREAYKK